jgi:hypothetical protein
MAEILCPECGKPNPDDLDTCRFCQASLKTGGAALPDWLRDLQRSEPVLPAEPTPSGEAGALGADLFGPAGDSELPDWLRQVAAPPVSAQPTASVPPFDTEDLAESPAAAGELPDWLAALGSAPESPAPPAAETPIQPAAAPAEEIPDWLAALGGTAQPPSPTPADTLPPPAETPAEETPDWFASLEKAAGPIAEGTEAQGVEWWAQPAEPASPPETPAAPPAGEMDWLTSLGESQEASAPAEEEPAATFGQAETPEWLAALGSVPAEKPSASVPAFTFGEGEEVELPAGDENRPLSTLPDWISQITAEKPEEPAAEPTEPDLAPAELPGWLEAMRPVETVAPTAPLEDLTGADVVSAGPLIGLRGVLSAEPEAIRARKPAAYALKLRVTDEQRSRLALMEELLSSEQKPKPLPAGPAITPQHFFRLGIALALFLPILWLVISQSLIVPLPTMESLPGVQDFYNELVDTPPGAPVLLAVDYEAGFTGEMEVGARTVVKQLARQQAYLVLMSTSTAGPALAQRLLAETAAMLDKPYTNAANLGYLPGGALGLVNLVASPPQSLPYTLDGIDPWSAPALSSIKTLADFSLVIVMTNDAETARAWIEQTSPALQAADVPLLLVTSAQTEPLVLPYTHGAQPQVQGMLAGLPAGVLFEHRTGIASLGSGMWDGFSLSLTIAALVILIGSVSGAVVAAAREGAPETKPKPKPGRKSESKQEKP